MRMLHKLFQWHRIGPKFSIKLFYNNVINTSECDFCGFCVFVEPSCLIFFQIYSWIKSEQLNIKDISLVMYIVYWKPLSNCKYVFWIYII